MRKLVYNFTLVFSISSLVLLIMLGRFGYPLTGIDDANIYFVYGRNLANGYGFVFNAGGEHVEGFTSLLWTLICALAFRFSSYPELLLLIFNLVILSLGIAVTLTYLQTGFLSAERKQQIGSLYSVLFLILLLTSPRFVVWNTVTLMENSLWSTLLLVTTIFAIKDHASLRAMNLGFISLVLLLLLIRPESILWAALFIGVLITRRGCASNLREGLKDLFPSIICTIAFLALLTAFRLSYFGYPFPNTYYAKVSPSFAYNVQQGSDYLVRYFISEPVTMLSITAILITTIHIISKIRWGAFPDQAAFLPVLAAAGLLFPLVIGGDHFGSFRFYQNIYPLLILSSFYFSDRILPHYLNSSSKSDWQAKPFILRLSVILIVALGLVLNQIYFWNLFGSETMIEFQVAGDQRKTGAFIQDLFSDLPKLPSIGVIAAGGIKYSYDGEIIDLMGLNNTLMAHNQGNRRGVKNHAAFEIPSFYKLEPEIVWPKEVNEEEWEYIEAEVKAGWENVLGFKGLFNDPEFLSLYSYAKVGRRTGTENHLALVAWLRRDFLETLGRKADFRVEKFLYTP